MKKCINISKEAIGNVSPNPLVGCVVLDKYNNIISEGIHKKYGEFHAERNALITLDNELTKDGTLIVNLEPCNHTGKTPPCTDIIIEKGIKKVIIGMRDVNPIVSGKGIARLKDAGIEVIEGVLESECRKLNEIFIKNMTEHKSFIAIKTATTMDGKIATSNGSSKWITSDIARDEVKNIRRIYDALLTTSATINADNPKMVARKKIILDRNLITDFSNAEIYKTGENYIFYDKNLNIAHKNTILKQNKNRDNLQFIPIDAINGKIDLCALLYKVYELGIMSIFVEGGGHICGSFVPYADKIYQFIAPKVLGDNKGISCFDYRSVSLIDEAIIFRVEDIKHFGPDILITYTK